MATPEEIVKMARDEAERKNLTDAGLSGVVGTAAPTPALAPSANPDVVPEIPALTTQVPLTQAGTTPPAPTLADPNAKEANAKLGTTPAPPEAITPAVAATSTAADQATADAKAKAEAQVYANALTGEKVTPEAAKPPQPQDPAAAPVDPNDPTAAQRDQIFDKGVAALNTASNIDMAAATRDDRHYNKETGQMDPGGNGILDEEEMKAHVSSITSAWQEADEGVKARVALDYKNNLEKLQEEQHRIKAQYSAMMEEVANTYINPSELWDKGGFGSRVGIPGAAALDTFFAMKGWNVPSFSAQWDKAVENNVIAQKSKLAQKEGKLAGFEKLWNMAGQISANEKEQIGYTSDLLKAATMGQYVHQLAPFKALAAAADAQALKADAMRKIGKDMMNTWGMMEQRAQARKKQIEDNALATAKAAMGKNAQRAKEQSQAAGAGVGNSAFASKNLAASWKHMSGWDATSVTPKDAARHARMFGQGVPGQQSKVINKLLGVEKGNWVPVEGVKNGKRTVIGFYDKASNGQGQEDKDVELLRKYLEAPEKLARFNEVYVQAVKEAAAEGETGFTAAGFAGQFFSKLKGQPNLTGARAELASMLAKDTLEELHRLSGGAVTESEAVRFNYLMPAILTDKSGAIRPDVNPAMARLIQGTEDQTSRLNQATGAFFPTQAPPANLDSEEGKAWVENRGPAKASLDILAAGMPGTYLQKTDIAGAIDVTQANSQKPAPVDAKDSALQPTGVIREGGYYGVTNAVASDAQAAFIAKAKEPGVQLSADQEASFAKLKNLPGQAEAEVARVWGEDKASWKGVRLLMGDAQTDMRQFRNKLPAEYRPAVDVALDRLHDLQKQADEREQNIRKRSREAAPDPVKTLMDNGSFEVDKKYTYDHNLAERPDSLAARDAIAKEYRDILASVYSDPASLIPMKAMKAAPSMLTQPNMLKGSK